MYGLAQGQIRVLQGRLGHSLCNWSTCFHALLCVDWLRQWVGCVVCGWLSMVPECSVSESWVSLIWGNLFGVRNKIHPNQPLPLSPSKNGIPPPKLAPLQSPPKYHRKLLTKHTTSSLSDQQPNKRAWEKILYLESKRPSLTTMQHPNPTLC